MPRSTMSIDVDADPAYAALGYIDGMVRTISTDAFSGSVIQFVHAQMAESFDKQLDMVALSNPENYHHVYEWRMTGMPRGRLWKHRLKGHGGTREASFEWKPSKAPILSPMERYNSTDNPNDPIHGVAPEDLKRLKKRKYFFYWKAPIMEYNTRVTIAPRYAKALFIPTFGTDKGFVLSKHAVQVEPGGNMTTGRFTGAWTNYWHNFAPAEFDQRIGRFLEKDMTDVDITQVARAQRKRTKTVGLMAYADAQQAFDAGELFAEAQFVGKAKKYDQKARVQFVKDRL